MLEPITTFGDVRAFFHADTPRDDEHFRHLFHEVREAFYRDDLHDEVEHQWLPYILNELDTHWDDAARHLYEGVDEDEGSPFGDRFFAESSPLYAMIRKLSVEEWNSSGPPELLLALTRAPDLGHITMLTYAAFMNQVSAESLKDALDRFAAREDHWRPRQLGLLSTIAGEHLEILAAHPLIEGLEVLNFYPGSCTAEELLELAKSPRLERLEAFNFGDEFQELHYSRHGNTHDRFLMPRDILRLGDQLPNLKYLLNFYPEPSLDEFARREQSVELPKRSTLERLEKSLEPFQKSCFPLYREQGESGGFYVELDAAQLDQEDWVPDSTRAEMAQLESWAYCYVLGTPKRKGGLKSAFDEQGNLLEPIVFHTYCQPDHQRTFVDQHPSYQGQYLIQTIFAQNGLVLIEEQDTHRLILLPDTVRPERSHLIDIFDSLRRSEMIYGGFYADYLCTFEEGIVGSVSGEQLRGAITWREARHRFDAHGNLTEDSPRQEVLFNGDILPFRNELRRYGLEMVPHAFDEYIAYIQVITPPEAS